MVKKAPPAAGGPERAALDVAKRELQSARQRCARIAKEGAEATALVRVIEASIASQNITDLMDGRTPATPDAAEVDRLRQAKAVAAASQGALPQAQQAVEAAEAAVREAQSARLLAKMRWLAASQEAAALELVTYAAGLAPFLARLRAIDSAKGSLTRTPFVGADVARLWSGAEGARRIIDGIPKRLRPPELDDEAMSVLTADMLIKINHQLEHDV